MTETTPKKLVTAAAKLFRSQGYAATGIGEILAVAGVPKGSLYHHFPGGKEDLALASAQLAGAQLVQIVDAAFADATDYNAGVNVLAQVIADIFDRHGAWQLCPITATLLDGPRNARFQAAAGEIFGTLQHRGAAHARRFGFDEDAAALISRKVLTLLEGAWVLARAQGRSDPIRMLAQML